MTAIRGSDILSPHLRDYPPQWQPIPAELLERLRIRSGFFLKEEWDKFDKILRSDWLLLENYQHFTCKECGGVHAYFTKKCVERPFNRLTSIAALVKNQPDVLHRDLVLEGISLGTIVPITQQEATRLVLRIEMKGAVIPEWHKQQISP